MKIKIEPTGAKPINLCVPTVLALNSITVGILANILKKHGISMKLQTLIAIKKNIKRYKRHHKDWNLLEVTSADGTYVLIRV